VQALVFQLQKAICSSPVGDEPGALNRETRHLLMVMTLLADGRTGVGTSSQETIARAMGCSARHIRGLLTVYTARVDAPIVLSRRRRGAALGRTSDEYTLSLRSTQPARCSDSASPPQQEQHSASEVVRNRNLVPLRLKPETERHDTSSGTVRQPKRNSASGGHPLDQLSDQRSSAAHRGYVPAGLPVAGAQELKLHYVAEFKRTRTIEPQFGKRWSRAMKAFGELVTTHGLETSKQIATRALGDRFTRRITPWELADDAMKHLGPQPAPFNVRPAQKGVQNEAEAQGWGSAGARKLLGG